MKRKNCILFRFSCISQILDTRPDLTALCFAGYFSMDIVLLSGDESEVDAFEEDLPQNFGENSVEKSDSIGSNLTRKRNATNFYLNEDRQCAIEEMTSKKNKRSCDASQNESSDSDTDDYDVSTVGSVLTQDEIPVADHSCSGEVSFRANVLSKCKLKAAEEVAPMPEMLKLCMHGDMIGENASYAVLCENIFSLVCSLVCERITTSGETMTDDNKMALYPKYYYEQCLACGIDSYLQDQLFHHVSSHFTRDAEGTLIWPPFYSKYIHEKYETRPLTGVQKNRSRTLKKISDEEGMRYNFALAIKTAASEAKTEINNRLTKLWRDPLDSGETPSGLFDAIRETTKMRDAYLRAEAAVNTKWPKKSRHGTLYEEAIRSKQEKFILQAPPSYFPNYWLTFAFYAAPAPPAKQLAIFKTVGIYNLQVKMKTSVDRTKVSKHSRRSLKKSELEKSNGTSSSKPQTPRTPRGDSPIVKDMQVQHIMRVQGLNEDKSEVGILRQTIAALQGAGRNADGTYICQDRITKYSEMLADALIKNLPNFDSFN